MPVYNGGSFLKEAIASILEQSFRNLELVLVNDGSTDESENIIRSFNDERIVYLDNGRNLGLIATLNKGLSACKGRYIARMDADDVSLPQRLQKQVDFLESHPEIAVLATRLALVDELGKETSYWNDDFETLTEAEIRQRLPKLNCLGHPTVMMRADVVKPVGYHAGFKHSEDWGLWLTLLSQGHRIAKLEETLLKYRQHASGTMVNVNKNNVLKRIVSFKRRYLLFSLSKGRFGAVERRVAKHWLSESLACYFPLLYAVLIKYAETRFATLMKQRKAFNAVFDQFPAQTRSLFFFPFYHLGGAEKVHTEIVAAAAFTKPIVLFTSRSAGNALLPAFQRHATVLEVDQLLVWPFVKRRLVKKISNACAKPGLTLFSSNSRFFYEFLAGNKQTVRAVDLIHAFMHKHEDSAEKWSLPVVQQLAARVIINLKTREDLKEHYLEHHVAPELLERVVYIPNFVEFHQKPEKQFDGILKLLYVGRGSAEKRVHLLARIAKEAKEAGWPVEFHFVGDVAATIPADCREACILHGEVSDAQRLQVIYAASHILAMASTREGFPVVIMEGMMQGLVPVTSAVGGIPQHIEPGVNGLLIHEQEAEAFVTAFKKALNGLLNDRQQLSDMSNNAYHYAVSHFDKKQFTEAYTRLFS